MQMNNLRCILKTLISNFISATATPLNAKINN